MSDLTVEQERNPLFKQVMSARELPTIIAILFFGLVIMLNSPAFLSSYNLQLLAKEIGVLGILAIAQMLVIITGGIDLSPGSMVALISVLAATGLERGLPIPIVLIVALIPCVLIGLVHSFFITRLGVAPFIITLGSLSVWRGLVIVLTQGYPVKIVNTKFLWLGQGDLFGIPIQFIIFVVVAAIYIVILLFTPLGRYIYSTGNNPIATRFSGIRVPRVLVFVYIQASVLFGLGGLIYAARLGQGMPGIGVGLEMPVIAAAVIGGTSMSGGSGTVWGTILGAILISLIMNALNLLAVSYFWQDLVTGLVIVLAVAFDILNRRRVGVR
jgi:ribose/xylose/arabinose/galactoside ABC-type transport system permease subunit